MRSYPDGSYTAKDIFPLPRVICAICLRCIYFELFYIGFKFFIGFIVYIQIINYKLILKKYCKIFLYKINKIYLIQIIILVNPISGANGGKNTIKKLSIHCIISFIGKNLETTPLTEPRPIKSKNKPTSLVKMLNKYFGIFLVNLIVFTLILSKKPLF